jgi:HEAT repeat protein
MRRHATGILLLVLAAGCGRKPYEGRSVAELEQMLGDDRPAVRVQGAYGLGLHGPEAAPAVPALGRALQAPDLLLRTQAAVALGQIGPDARAAVPQLEAALGDAEWTVRRQAALSLGQIGPDARAALPALSRLQSHDPNGLVRKAAREAVSKIANSATSSRAAAASVGADSRPGNKSPGHSR